MPRLILLGGAVLRDESGVVPGPAARRHPLAAMALLASAPRRTMSRSKLVGLLWPDSPEDVARRRLNTCLHNIRRGIGSETLASVGDDVQLDTGTLECDLVRFEEAVGDGRWADAVEAYGGPFLDGFDLGGSSAFEQRVEVVRARLRHLHLDALEALAEEAEARGDDRAAAAWWLRRSAEDPYDARVTVRRMQALARAGGLAEALEAAETHAELRRRELDAEPSEEVLALADRLRANDRTRVGLRGASSEEEREERLPASSPGAAPDAPHLVPWPADPGTRRSRRWVLPAAALALVVVGFAALRLRAPAPPPAPSGRPGVAVLPFESVGRDRPTPFTEGLRWDLLTRLSRVPELAVLSASSAERLAQAPGTLAETAGELGIEWVVRGEVQQAGDQVRVGVRLLDAPRDRQVWASSYLRELTLEDLLQVQAEITRDIADALEVRVVEGPEGGTTPPAGLEPYLAYIQGMSHLARWSEVGIERAEGYFLDALRRDSSYAPAWAGLAEAGYHRRSSGYGPAPDSVPSPAQALDRALALDPDLPHATGLQAYHRGRGAESVEALRRAVKEGSDVSMRVRLAQRLRQIGRLDASVEELERALEVDPLDPAVHATLASSYLFARRPEDALARMRRARELAPGWADLHLGEGATLVAMGRNEEGARLLRSGLEAMSPGSAWRMPTRLWLGVAEARTGEPGRARALLAELPEEAGLYRAILFLALGEEEAAEGALADAHSGGMDAAVLRYHPSLDPIRDTEGYQAALEALELRLGQG